MSGGQKMFNNELENKAQKVSKYLMVILALFSSKMVYDVYAYQAHLYSLNPAIIYEHVDYFSKVGYAAVMFIILRIIVIKLIYKKIYNSLNP
jgi:hypothetical protein